MGRIRSFDRADAARAAREVFWHHGYEGAAVPALEEATGLGRSSLYHAFGSKRGLFDAAVDSYLDEVVRPRLRPLQGDPVSPAAAREYLAGLKDALGRASTLPATSGCLLINAAAAPIGDDHAVAETIAAYRAELRDALAAGVAARHPRRGAAERARLAEALAGLVVAALATVRVDAAAAASALDTAIELLEG
ncbi:TetR/AcrR family transcriptional regulator [Microbacterium karelineae]|uniref:TetR/AcrR family transcriptional regulator n=1 Tax=Microbacterium karelineae TaxID=2654283 RepID=UPI0012EA25B2|nr:TetR/AcrR family transcriptional regulator [Microbacterium karelineae]